MDSIFKAINDALGAILFFDLSFGAIEGGLPFLVVWLVSGGVYLTLKMKFVNVRMMPHAIQIVRERYNTADDKGEVTPFQSLATALSATVGLGNIAGVALAVSIGGPGATFWMILAGFLGMTLKFTEVSLSIQHRVFLKDGTVMGGGMEYLSRGLAAKGMPKFGKGLAMLFAFFMICGALGGGNAFQASQALGAISSQIGFFEEFPLAFGILLGLIVGAVIIGGIKRIAHTAEKIVPTMVILYVTASVWILLANAAQIPAAIGTIISQAFAPVAVTGGIVGVVVQGFQRAVFSSEAGIGSAPVAHAAARVKYPVRQGMVALYEPFIDTIVVCTMTALVIVITGVYDNNGEFAALIEAKDGAALTSAAYGKVLSWFPVVLTVSISLFAFSTMISWSYYGERAWVYLFGPKYSLVFKLIFIAFTLISTVTSTALIVDFSFLLLLAMAMPNILGLFILAGDVRKGLDEYMVKLKSGELDKEAIRN